jgi:hypothetical protein
MKISENVTEKLDIMLFRFPILFRNPLPVVSMVPNCLFLVVVEQLVFEIDNPFSGSLTPS